MKVVEAADVARVTRGDKAIEQEIVAAAVELERMGVKAISSNCGFMLHYQDAVREAVSIPVFLSSLLQLPLIARSIRPRQSIAVLTAFAERLTPDVLRLAGLPDDTGVVVSSIETAPEFRSMQHQDLDTEAFGQRLEQAARALCGGPGDTGALLLVCAVFPPYAARLQQATGVPVYDFVSLIDHARQVTRRTAYF
jgi:Asp/Glu/hydantoin racemase